MALPQLFLPLLVHHTNACVVPATCQAEGTAENTIMLTKLQAFLEGAYPLGEELCTADQASVMWLAACSSWPPFTQLSDTTLSLDDVLPKPLISTLSLEPHLHFHWLWPVHRPPPAPLQLVGSGVDWAAQPRPGRPGAD